MMAELTHGTDLSLSPTLGPLVRELGTNVRQAVDRVAAMGFGSLQLDATLKGIRPRELSRSGRRDLHALIRRRGPLPAGLDCFIPAWHYTSLDHGERALAATLEAIELAADLGRLPVSLTLPATELAGETARTIVDAADRYDIRLAVHDGAHLDALIQWIDGVDHSGLGAGLDPAEVLATEGDPTQAAQRLAGRLTLARLGDLERGTVDSGRCAVGDGQLDVATYRVSVDLAEKRIGPVVVELRGLHAPLAAARRAGEVWINAAFNV